MVNRKREGSKLPRDDRFSRTVKRLFDIAASAVGIVLLFPLMLMIALGVRFSGSGPIFFRQKRVGMFGELFTILKFRSMVCGEEDDNKWTTQDDPRRTPFGRIIRKYSLDELPQLFNVLKGEMSLVGPRPETPYFSERFALQFPDYRRRQEVRPGMTGLAQINGLRGDTDISTRLDYDLWYIDHRSFLLDLRILMKTVLFGWRNEEKL